MAYRKTKSTRGTYRNTVRKSKRGTGSRPSTKRGSSRRGGSQTIRIVVEQPQAVSSVSPTNTQPARKAVF